MNGLERFDGCPVESPLETMSLNLQKVWILIHQEIEQCKERGSREPNHIVVIAFYLANEKTAETLNVIMIFI